MPLTVVNDVGEVIQFLREFKTLMREGRYIIRKHNKNIQTLIDLGITSRMRDDTLLALKVCDYSSGPNNDEYGKADYWVFGKEIDNVEVYIKLQIVVFSNGNEQAVCISFHTAEYALKYPFKTA
jgi:hypothetical protein